MASEQPGETSARESARLARVRALVREAIHGAGGTIPFSRFMELALYAPDDGYYEHSPARVGRAGDFYTSASVGPVFGELLAFRFLEWADAAGWDRFRCVEAGAHDGRLASDILSWIEIHRPDWRDRMEYVVVEPSATRRRWQRDRLASFGERVSWVDRVPPGTRGVIFGNELLDAFPVECFGWDAGEMRWFLQGVGLGGDGFEWRNVGVPDELEGLLPDVPQALLDVLPAGFAWERSPSAERWWADAGRSLAEGWMVAIDYGMTEMECFTPGKNRGTVRGYRGHRFVDDLLADPGDVDLTAHVNFTRIEKAGMEAGLGPGTLVEQRRFLSDILGRTLRPSSGFGDWSQARTRQFQTLTHPQHHGRSFRVLVQEKPAGHHAK
jgi:SAM-dependent MidA family methyltransferase